MHCFRHQDTHAVGFCMNCGAATCTACVQRTVGQRIACSGECAANLNRLIGMSEDANARVAKSHAVTAWFTWLVGFALAAYSAYAVIVEAFWSFLPYGLGMSAIFIGVGFFYWRLAKRHDASARRTAESFK